MSNIPSTNLTNLNASLTGSIASDQAVNYIGTESGANNALVASLTNVAGETVTVAAGLRILLKTGHTLQATTNTLNLNSSGAKSIVKNTNSAQAANIGTVYAVGAILDLVYDGTNWQMLGTR